MEQSDFDSTCRPGETLVFVYGTSMSGEPNHQLMTGARFITEGKTQAEFDLVDLGGFPAMVRGGETCVDGEIYAVTAGGVRYMDEVEDHPDYFRRTSVKLENGPQVNCYLLPPDHGRPFPRITSGSWRHHGLKQGAN
jgi:gamma-glutamylaminecyclotransferase